MRRSTLKTLHVRTAPGSRTRGWLTAGPLAWPVALGRGGILANKREGDGGTPRGTFRALRLWWRAERNPRPATGLPVRRIGAHDAWCEDPADRRYNRPIRMAAGEPGDRPRVARRGSAVFVHVAKPGLGPTAGCVAMPKARLRHLLRKIGTGTRIAIH